MFDLHWSQSEKKIARRAFEQALDCELTALIREAKERVNQVSTPDELWEVEAWLTKRRKEINETYEFRYSVLPLVFAKLMYRRLLSEDDLKGLGPEKVDLIRRGFGVHRPEASILGTAEGKELGTIPIRSLTADRIRCLVPRYRSVVCIETCPRRN